MASKYTPQFRSPSGAGRPPKVTNLPLEIVDFSEGMDNYMDSIASSLPLYFGTNLRSYRGRTLDRRLGYSLVGAAQTSKGSYMLSTLLVVNGNDLMLRISDTATTGVNLAKYSTSGGWVSIGDIGDDNDKVAFTACQTVSSNVGRTYFTNGVSPLMYTEGSSIVEVSDGGTDVIGKYIANVQNILVLGNLSGTFSSNQLVWSKAGTHQFRKDVDTDYASSSNLITLDSEITGIKTLGWLVYIFTKTDGLWELDLATGIPRKISTHGTRSPKSIAVGHDSMIWADYYGIWMLTMGGSVQKVSDKVKSVYESIDATNIENFNATIDTDGVYKLWVGDTTYEGTTYTDMVLVLDIEQSRNLRKLVWWIDTKKESNFWTNWTNETGATNSYFIDQVNGSTFLDGTGYNDNSADIDFVWQSKDFMLMDEKHEYLLKEIYIKLEPDNSEDTSITIERRKDKGEWETVKAFTLTSSTDDLKMVRMSGLMGMTGRSLGLRISSSDNASFRILEMLVMYNKRDSEIRPFNTSI